MGKKGANNVELCDGQYIQRAYRSNFKNREVVLNAHFLFASITDTQYSLNNTTTKTKKQKNHNYKFILFLT